MDINNDLAKLATTASVLVNSATANANINDMLQRNRTYASTFDTRKTEAGNQPGLINLLAIHGDNIRVAKSLKRSNFTGDGSKKKDFTVLTNDMLKDIPDSELENDSQRSDNTDETPFSLFQGFSAVLPEVDETIKIIKENSGKMIEGSKGNKRNGKATTLASSKRHMIENITIDKIKMCQNQRVLLGYKSDINYYLDLLEIRKGLGKSEISEIDAKIDRLYMRRKELSENIGLYEKQEMELENHLLEIKDRLDFIKDIEISEEPVRITRNDLNEDDEFAMNSDKNKTNANKDKIKTKTKNKNKNNSKIEEEEFVLLDEKETYSRKTSTTRSFKSGDLIHKFEAHHDPINCIAFDEPYGRLITCSMDNTVRLWDMGRYKCIGLLEGHFASVDCVSIQDDLAFTGSRDATLKMWNLNYFNSKNTEEETPLIHSFEGHVDTVTAVSYNNGELVSGSDDKTIRQWDLSTGHLLQTIDIMWASSMANSTISFGKPSAQNSTGGNIISNQFAYPYISSLQVFDAALASGGNDGVVRLWDLRSGEVIRQLIGHTGAITTLQFDKRFNLVTGSADRSVRVWDLRTGGLLDSFSYESPIKKIVFDDFKIASVVENQHGIHIYDRSEQRHWKVGAEDSSLPVGVSDTNDIACQGNYLVEGSSDGVVRVWNV